MDIEFAVNSIPKFFNFFIVNNASNEKLVTGYTMEPNTAGAGNPPNRKEWVCKWTDTTNLLNQIQIKNNSSAQFLAGSTIKVWGHN